MRILILGNNHSAKSFYKILNEDKNNIVFTTNKEVKNNIEYTAKEDIIDFLEANEIDFVLITEEKYIDPYFQEQMDSLSISYFSPTIEAVEICKYKSSAKKFINKNKFLTPKYFIAEKNNLAGDYVKNAEYPLAIKPDIHNPKEALRFCETYSSALKTINDFFENGNKKIIVEDYILGKNVTIWTISDGYSAKIIGSNAKYQNNISLFEPEFLTEDIKENILKNIINPTITSLAEEEKEYIGILGFDIILSKDNKAYLIGFNSFFDDISVDFYTNCYDLNWLKVFESCIVGDIFTKFDFKPDTNYALTIRNEEKINLITANFKSNLNKYIIELDLDNEDYKEAKKLWKY